MIGDTYLDPFATMTWRQKEVLSEKGKKSEYLAVKGTTAIDFRGDNDKNIQSLKKIVLIFMLLPKVYTFKIKIERLKYFRSN